MSSTLPYLVCLLVTGIFSSHYVVSKMMIEAGVSVYSLASWRGIFGGIFILFFARKNLSYLWLKKYKFTLLIISFLGFFLNQLFFMQGLKLTTALNTALISNTIPVVSLTYAFLFKQEEFHWKKVVGTFISFACVLVLIIGPAIRDLQLASKGNFFIFLNVLSFCGALALTKRLLRKDFPFQVLTGTMLLCGGLMMALVAGKEFGSVWNYGRQGMPMAAQALFEILVSTAIAYYFNTWTLKKLEVTSVTAFIYLQPLITALLTWNFPMEKVPIYMGILIGGYMILTTHKSES